MRLVLVDNDPSALELLELDLTLEGHEVVGTASQGEVGIEVVASTNPDAVVLDYRMPPGIDGLEVARRLRRQWPDLRVLMYTNHVRSDLVQEARHLAVPFLRKGDLAALRRAVMGG